MLEVVLAVIISYLLGSFPTGLLIGRLTKGIDIRNYGSGNIGATNVWRILGPGPALIALVGDLGKGAAAVLIGLHMGPPGTELLTAFAVILGHGWSIFLRFQGGKMIATSIGALALLSPKTVAIAIVIWLAVVGISRFVSLGSIAAILSVPVTFALLKLNIWYTVFGIVLAALAIYKHRSNIKRLLNGSENKFSLRK
ncbi:MAG: glycerol-3-phosphate 1-O-acyltransferase PlsY [Peptococcaceae bacterium]|nr:glycerol-3-phosphate 1-O-acyltransferase PlsY [Peptococcaceae bacterium]